MWLGLAVILHLVWMWNVNGLVEFVGLGFGFGFGFESASARRRAADEQAAYVRSDRDHDSSDREPDGSRHGYAGNCTSL